MARVVGIILVFVGGSLISVAAGAQDFNRLFLMCMVGCTFILCGVLINVSVSIAEAIMQSNNSSSPKESEHKTASMPTG